MLADQIGPELPRRSQVDMTDLIRTAIRIPVDENPYAPRKAPGNVHLLRAQERDACPAQFAGGARRV